MLVDALRICDTYDYLKIWSLWSRTLPSEAPCMSQRDRLIGNNGFVHSLHFASRRATSVGFRPKGPVQQLQLLFTAININS